MVGCLGPAVPEFVAQTDGECWIITTYEGEARWIRTNRLRSRQQVCESPLRIECFNHTQ